MSIYVAIRLTNGLVPQPEFEISGYNLNAFQKHNVNLDIARVHLENKHPAHNTWSFGLADGEGDGYMMVATDSRQKVERHFTDSVFNLEGAKAWQFLSDFDPTIKRKTEAFFLSEEAWKALNSSLRLTEFGDNEASKKYHIAGNLPESENYDGHYLEVFQWETGFYIVETMPWGAEESICTSPLKQLTQAIPENRFTLDSATLAQMGLGDQEYAQDFLESVDSLLADGHEFDPDVLETLESGELELVVITMTEAEETLPEWLEETPEEGLNFAVMSVDFSKFTDGGEDLKELLESEDFSEYFADLTGGIAASQNDYCVLPEKIGHSEEVYLTTFPCGLNDGEEGFALCFEIDDEDGYKIFVEAKNAPQFEVIKKRLEPYKSSPEAFTMSELHLTRDEVIAVMSCSEESENE